MTTIKAVLPKTCEVGTYTQEQLTRAKTRLMVQYPFLGFLLLSCDFLFTEEIPTLAATTLHSKNRVFINEHCFINILENDNERSFALAHEMCHIFFEHIDQGLDYNYNPELWNISTDYFINGHLHRMKSKYMTLPTWVLYRDDLLDKDSHTIYHQLLDENDGDVNRAIQNNGGTGLDEIEAGASISDIGGNGKGAGNKNGIPIDRVARHKTEETHKADNKQTVVAAVESPEAQKEIGDTSGSLLRELNDFVTPIIPWTEELRDFVIETCKEDYTYSKVSRRSSETIVFPGMDGQRIRLVFGVDTSGSMSNEELRSALTELQGIIDAYEGWEVHLISCDTNAHLIGEYSSDEGDSFATVNKDLIGGGGTELSPMIRYAEEMDEQPNVIVIITDGYIPEEPYDNAVDPEVPVLTVVTKNGNESLHLENSRIIYMNDMT